MGFSNMMMAACKSIPKSTMTQSIPSLTYSSCSTTNMWWLKNCWSFSLTKLMEICSKPLYSKISKPAISRTAQKFAFLSEASIRVSLHFSMSHLKIRSKMALAIPPVAMVACSTVWPLVTHSVPTLILGLQKALNRGAASTPHRAAILPGKVEGVRGVLQLLVVVDGGDGGLALGDVDVVVDVSGELALVSQTSLADSVSVRLDKLVEDVVRSLHLLLLSNTRLLQQVGDDVATSQLTVGLQDGVGGHNLVLKRDLLLGLLAGAGGDHGQ